MYHSLAYTIDYNEYSSTVDLRPPRVEGFKNLNDTMVEGTFLLRFEEFEEHRRI